ncbi:CsgG/HfaB family protein [Neisseriaceae bacterium ESL0693]|nr:CsgG/HfaB family protein [Neisseriaceae bacterium ESL0693]
MKPIYLPLLAILALSACATESSQIITSPTVETAQQHYQGIKAPLSIGQFNDHSNASGGIFGGNQNRIGNQAKTILTANLQQTGYFSVLDRSNMNETKAESQIRGTNQKLKGARYVVTGDITEFGRKTVGDQQFFGILGQGKTQIAYAKVTLNVVDVNTSEVVFSSQGAGEFQLSSREILGNGGKAGYDSTLNGKVLDLAIREAVNNLVRGIDQQKWNPHN